MKQMENTSNKNPSSKMVHRMESGGAGVRAKLVSLFIAVVLIALVLMAMFAWRQINVVGSNIRNIAVDDATAALESNAVAHIERLADDIAGNLARFLYDRDSDILTLAHLPIVEEAYEHFAQRTHSMMKTGSYELAPDGESWVDADGESSERGRVIQSNIANDEVSGLRSRPADRLEYDEVPLFDEVTFVGLDGVERIKITAKSSKRHHPMSRELRDISKRENTYVKAETYFDELKKMKPGEIYVSEVIGAYVPTNKLGMYTPSAVDREAEAQSRDIDYAPEAQAFAGLENPHGRRFEGIIRWATPVADASGRVIGYATFALNHDHIMSFTDHTSPLHDSLVEMLDAGSGSYAFMWDYKCRSIAHPRHSAICGFDPKTGDRQTPWLAQEVYDAWKGSGIDRWADYEATGAVPTFHEQSRQKSLSAELEQQGLVALDGRYLNNAPQCTGWMDLTEDGGAGSFYFQWSDVSRITSVAAVPYFTGRYAPSEANGHSRRGFGFVTLSAALDSFTEPTRDTEEKINAEIAKHLGDTTHDLAVAVIILVILAALIALFIASWFVMHVDRMISGMVRFRRGELHYRFDSQVKDEFGLLQDTFNIMADAICSNFKHPLVIIDNDFKIIHMNDHALAFCGMSDVSQAVGITYGALSIYPTGSASDPIAALQKGTEAAVWYDETSGRWLKPTASYVIDASGARTGYMIESLDVTEMTEMQRDVERAMRDAEAASMYKTTFLARMSHEIRTPMNAIIGLTGVVHRKLEEGSQSEQDRAEILGHIDKVESASRHMLNMLNDILDISKIDSGTLKLIDEPQQLEKFVESIDSIARMMCEEREIEYTSSTDGIESVVGSFDALRLRQVITNLLSNAVKFTAPGDKIEFSMHKVSEDEGRTLYRFAVRDSGIGIAKEKQAKMFDAFEQGDEAVTRSFGGAGLGLPIVRSIVRLFGGEISVDSEQGKGAEFSFEIWLKTEQEKRDQSITVEEMEGKLTGKRLMLVDDVEINRVIVEAIMEDTGIEIDEAADGSEAVKLFSESPVGTYDMILMDIMMPVMDGYEASSAIRALDRPDAVTVPIVALSANAFKDDIEKSFAHKMDAHLAKPVDEGELMGAFAKFILGI